MKKFISLMLLFAVLISCCACAQKEAPAPTVDPSSAEGMFGHIDQTKPVDGVYKIWNAEGVKLMSGHPEANFEILCNVDMQGSALQPIGTPNAPFAGTLQGGEFTISNFTLVPQDGVLGFVGVNKGTVRGLKLEAVTMTADESTQFVGALAAINEGQLIRSYAVGTVDATKVASDAAVGGAIGKNTGSYTNGSHDVDLTVAASANVAVGGIVGATKGGTISFIQSNGQLTVTVKAGKPIHVEEIRKSIPLK